jgi:teichoic acid transport system permease protein
MTDTAVAGPAHSLSGFAVRHGLHAAGQRPMLGAYLRQLWRYRHFTAAYANAQVVASITNTRLGRLWQVLTPLMNAAIYYFIFGVILGTSRGMDTSVFIAYLCTGLFIFHFTQTAVINGARSVSNNLGLIRALHFPRATLPIATTLTQAQNLLASMAVLVAIVLATGEKITPTWLSAVPALALQTTFNLGLALILARVGAKIADVKQVLPFVLRTWMYGSGVLYSVELFAEHLPPTVAQIMLANPLLVYIELMRHALVASAPDVVPLGRLWLLAAAWAVVVLIVGVIFFWRGEKEYGRG